MNRWTISDIHGCADTFKALLQKIHFDKEDELYLLGDYLDRGPNSKGVIDHIWQLQKDGFNVQCLRGNHEQIALDALKNLDDERLWMMNGGPQTLMSFGVDTVQEIPVPYLDFLQQLPYYFEVDRYILVHAGLNFDEDNPLEDQESMMWIRRWYQDINYYWLGNRIIVHGHTPLKKEAIEFQHQQLKIKSVLDIDGGCIFNLKGMGHLCAFNLGNQELVFQANIEKS